MPPTMERARPPNIGKRNPKACGAKRIRKTDPNPRSRKHGSPCSGTWAFVCRGCGVWARRTRANGSMSWTCSHAETFPHNTLFCGDAGFVGYPLWSHILNSGADFLVRVGANVSLLMSTPTACGEKRRSCCAGPKPRSGLTNPPCDCGCVKVRVGTTKIWLLTSVLEQRKTDCQEADVRFYKMRWGLEVEFRGLKQTLDRRHCAAATTNACWRNWTGRSWRWPWRNCWP